MQRLEVSRGVRRIYTSLGAKGLNLARRLNWIDFPDDWRTDSARNSSFAIQPLGVAVSLIEFYTERASFFAKLCTSQTM